MSKIMRAMYEEARRSSEEAELARKQPVVWTTVYTSDVVYPLDADVGVWSDMRWSYADQMQPLEPCYVTLDAGLYAVASESTEPPRRYSIDELDTDGYQNYLKARLAGKIVKVWLDGVEIDRCTMADESTGEVEVYVYPYAVKDGNLVLEIRRGAVRVELVDDLSRVDETDGPSAQ